MNKSEIIEAISKKFTALKKKDVEAVVEAYYEIVTETLSKGEAVAVKGFGTLSVRERKATTGHNPKTGAKIDIAAKKVLKFTPSSNLKNAVEG
jgi:DNA-binding protein HU-beta